MDSSFVIFTMSALTNLDERPAVLLLGRRLLNLTDNSAGVAERASLCYGSVKLGVGSLPRWQLKSHD